MSLHSAHVLPDTAPVTRRNLSARTGSDLRVAPQRSANERIEISPCATSLIAQAVCSAPADVLIADRDRGARAFLPAAIAVVNDARRADTGRVERLIVALRPVWNALPDVRRISATEREELWMRLVTACIEEFYATRTS
jgi:hypothetical protein